MRIRECKLKDLGTIQRFESKLDKEIKEIGSNRGASIISKELFLKMTKLGVSFCILYHKNKEVGLVVLNVWSNKECEILQLYIDKNHRRKGFGKSLINYLFDVFKPITLRVDKVNVKAMKFYKSIGFGVVGEKEHSFELKKY